MQTFRNFYRVLPLVLILSFLAITANAQTNSSKIAGTIKTSDNEYASGVSVILKEINKQTVSNEKGAFTFKVKPGTYTIAISMMGMKNEEKQITVEAGQTASADFTLTENLSELNEVVVTSLKTMNKKTLSAAKMNVPAMDMPMTVAVIGKGVIEQQQSIRLSEVIRNANGVYLSSARGSTQETFGARGYNFSSNNMFKNGFRVNTGAIPEVSSLERVEILKGSAALLYGNVAPGGILNMVTKKPKFEPGAKVAMTYGSYDLYRPVFDVYGPLSSSIAYRVNGTYENSGSFRDNVSNERFYVNPSLLFKLSDKTTVIVEGDYLHHNFTPDFGTAAINNVIADIPRNRYLGALWSDGVAKQATATVSVSHELNNSWQLNGGVSYQNYDRQYQSTERIQPLANGDWGRPLNKAKVLEDYLTAQLNLTGKFNTGAISHNILAGVDADKYKNTSYTYVDANKYLDGNNTPVSAVYDSINVLDPAKFTPRTDKPVMNPFRYTETPTNRFGAYVNDLISLTDKFKVLAGLRWSYQYVSPVETHNVVTNTTTSASTGKEDKAFSPKIGLVYKPLSTTSLFASYSNSFVTNTGNDVLTDEPIEPSIVDQYEAGIKNDFFNGNLSVNLTAYRIINNNLVQTAPFAKDGVTPNTNTNLKVVTGQATSDGLEIDIAGQPVKGLDILAGYSYNNARYTKTTGQQNSNIEGERILNTPKHTANASVFYTFCNDDLKGFRLGVSAFYIGERLGGFPNLTAAPGQPQPASRIISVKGFTTVDVSAGYTYKKVSLIAKVSNIGDVLNYNVHENYSINPIPPRQFITTLAYQF